MWDLTCSSVMHAALAAVLVSAGHSGQMIAQVPPWAYAEVCDVG